MTDAQNPPSDKKYRSKHADPNYKGEASDKSLENGPLEKRSCTDILCCLIFIAYITGMVIVSGFALQNGNPSQLVAPYDYDGNQCGLGNFSDYKYLYFAVPFQSYTQYTVCLKSCPTYATVSAYPSSVDCKTNTGTTSCNSALSDDAAMKSFIQSISTGTATPAVGKVYIYNSTSFVDRYCVPSLTYFTELSAVANSTAAGDTIEKWISDIEVSWTIILASLGIAFVIGLFYMIFIRCCSGVLVWLTIIGLIASLAGFGYYLFYYARKLASDNASTTAQGGPSPTSTNTITAIKVFAYVFWGLAVFTILAVCCLYGKIKLTIGILKTAADYVKSTWTSILVPIFMIILLVCLYVYWIFTGIYLYSYGTITQYQNTPFGTVVWNTNTKRLLIYHLFGGLWINAFVIALSQLVLAGSVAMWYFNVAYDRASATVGKSVYRALRYHFGSVAFGSFIVAVIQLIRIIWAYIQKQLKPYEEKVGGCLIKYAVCYITYCLDCFERYIRFLNKNAYIQIALEGKSFLPSAISAFYLILRNGMMFVLVGGLGEIFIGFGKWVIGIATAGIGYVILTQVDYYSLKMYSALMPAFIMFCLGFAIGALFMSVYGMAADTILQCYILTKDLMQNHSINIKPPSTLQDFIDSHDEVKKQDQGHQDQKKN